MDCKIVLDDNAVFRQKQLFALADKSQVDEMELRAQKADLNYIRLNGNIGCMGKSVFFLLRDREVNPMFPFQ